MYAVTVIMRTLMGRQVVAIVIGALNVYTMLMTFYHVYTPLLSCSYWGYGIVFHYILSPNQQNSANL